MDLSHFVEWCELGIRISGSDGNHTGPPMSWAPRGVTRSVGRGIGQCGDREVISTRNGHAVLGAEGNKDFTQDKIGESYNLEGEANFSFSWGT